MSERTKERIYTVAKKLFATHGNDGVSMRNLAQEVGVAQSVLYHYFGDKDELLKEIFNRIGKELGAQRAELPPKDTVRELIRQRVEFQFTHAEEVVYVLKYYLHYRPDFLRLKSGFIPDTAYRHIHEVLKRGVEDGQLADMDIDKQAKIVTHLINGFVLEYYPEPPTGKELLEVTQDISDFIMRALEGGRKAS